MQKQIDEIKIKRQGSHNGDFPKGGFVCIRTNLFAHRADLLGIVGSQTDKHDDARQCNHPVNPGTVHKKVDHHRQNDAPQAHHAKRAQAGQIAFGHGTVKGHRAEHAGGDKKGAGHGCSGIEQQHKRQRHAVQRGVGQKTAGCSSGTQGFVADRKHHHHRKFRDQQPYKQHRVLPNGQGQRRMGRQQGDRAGQTQTRRHPVEDHRHQPG